MDGKGRALDNIMVERLWRSVKYEDVYVKDYTAIPELVAGLRAYFEFYNHERPHQGLGSKTPAEVYYGEHGIPWRRNKASMPPARNPANFSGKMCGG
jgi:putative transposase